MPFSFRLQSVLDYRQALADRKRAEVAVAERQLREEENRLAALYVAHAQAMDGYEFGQDVQVDVTHLDHLTVHLQELETSIAIQVGAVERMEAVHESARAELLGLEKDAKTLEKLRDRQHEEYEAEAGRRDRIDANEVALTFHRRFKGSV